MDDLRPEMVALVDAFDFTDHSLGSTIGRKDGNDFFFIFMLMYK